MAKKNKSPSRNKISRDLDQMEKSGADSIKVPIQIRLDGDLYVELKRRAELGEAQGKYQTLLNQVLREALFNHKLVDPVELARTIVNRALDKIVK